MDEKELQDLIDIAKYDMEFDQIRHFMKNSDPPYDDYYWEDEVLEVVYKGKTIERYTKEDLIEAEILDYNYINEGLQFYINEIVNKFPVKKEDL
jgi:hypothetical protein